MLEREVEKGRSDGRWDACLTCVCRRHRGAFRKRSAEWFPSERVLVACVYVAQPVLLGAAGLPGEALWCLALPFLGSVGGFLE